jgi:hypothetical protein
METVFAAIKPAPPLTTIFMVHPLPFKDWNSLNGFECG